MFVFRHQFCRTKKLGNYFQLLYPSLIAQIFYPNFDLLLLLKVLTMHAVSLINLAARVAIIGLRIGYF